MENYGDFSDIYNYGDIVYNVYIRLRETPNDRKRRTRK